LLLRERLDPAAREELSAIYAREIIAERDVDRVLALMDAHEVRQDVEQAVAAHHDAAAAILASAARNPHYQARLQALVESLAIRTA
ncbi:MAG: hypothetical protein KC442_09290, partial [Thermomicrobiales bacterium]|nr:hypothetical protein [Thermomicrobiales bacterium]